MSFKKRIQNYRFGKESKNTIDVEFFVRKVEQFPINIFLLESVFLSSYYTSYSNLDLIFLKTSKPSA